MSIRIAPNKIISAKKYVSTWCSQCSHTEVCQIKKVAEYKDSHVLQCEQREVRELVTCDSDVCSYCAYDMNNSLLTTPEGVEACNACDSSHRQFVGKELWEIK